MAATASNPSSAAAEAASLRPRFRISLQNRARQRAVRNISCSHSLVKILVCLCLLAPLRLPAQNPLPGTAPLTAQGDLAARMVDDINAYLLRATTESVAKRAPNRERLKKIIGAVDPRPPGVSVELDATTSTPA